MEKQLRISWAILLAVSLLSIAISLVYLVWPTIFLSGEFLSATGRNLSAFAISNPKEYSFFMSDELQQALFMSSLAIVQLVVVLSLYRNANRMGWYIGVVLVTLSLGTIIGCDIPTGNLPIILMAVGVLLVSYVGFAIGIKPILSRQSQVLAALRGS